MAKVVLTADRTLMSEYNKNVFLGFAACSPKLISSWLYKKIFCPPIEDTNGRAKFGHCGQRKIEAALLNHGFTNRDVVVAPPEKLRNVVSEETKVLCITTHDPLGLGPASSTFSGLGNKETFSSLFFRKLVTDPIIRAYNLHVIVGGSGSWQLTDEQIMAKLGIDCVVVGEGEITAVTIVNDILNGMEYPPIVQGEVVPLDQIPIIRNPTLNGIIEVCRGCGRGCSFCNPTMLNFRCLPVEKIYQEAKINVEAGNGVLFHAEDVLRYNAKKKFIPDKTAVLNLFTKVQQLTNKIGISHFAHASVVAKPDLVEELADLLDAGSSEYPFISGQVGIETGSVRLASRYMKGKAKPFKPEEWPEVVIQSHKILSDNRWVPVETLIIGLPGEIPDDVRKTIDLVEDLSGYKSLMVPLFFVPLGSLQVNGFFQVKDTHSEHWRLLAACWSHNFKWVYRLAEESMSTNRMREWKKWALHRVIHYMERKMRPYLDSMKNGVNPLTRQKTVV